jgi:hypothetical protein
MTAAFVNGSPRPALKSNSALILGFLKAKIGDRADIFDYNVAKDGISDDIFKKLNEADALFLSFPLYADALPAHLLEMMARFEEYRKSGGRDRKPLFVYAAANTGFYEGEANRCALKIVENWCARSALVYGQGLGQGAGEMLGFLSKVPMGRGPLKNLGAALSLLAENLLSQTKGENLLFSPNFPYFLWRFMAVYGFFLPLARKNGLKMKDIYRKPDPDSDKE